MIKKLSTLPRDVLLTIYISFVRPHSDYSDITYDQPQNESFSDIFRSTFLQPVNGSKNLNLELSYKTQSLNVFFFFFVFEASLKDFPFYSIILTLRFRLLQTCIKESCM